MTLYKLVACGGTFDLLHNGHKAFLKFALARAERLVIGLTSDTFASKKNTPFTKVQSFKKRRKALLAFLKTIYKNTAVEIISIDDMYGPTLQTNFSFDAIIVTKDSIVGAKRINLARKEKGLRKLTVIKAQLILDSKKKILSSSIIRKGIIDRKGNPYLLDIWFEKTLHITPLLRKQLGKPFGKIIPDFEKWIHNNKNPEEKILITVGDVVTQSFAKHKLIPHLAVIDFHVERHKKFSRITDLGLTQIDKIISVHSPAGSITPSLFFSLIKAADSINASTRSVILIEGEDDLSVLPLILNLPLESVIYYGQPGIGVIEIRVTENVKKTAYNFLTQFSVY